MTSSEPAGGPAGSGSDQTSEHLSGPASEPASSQASEPDIGALPPAVPAMWRLMRIGYQHEPRLLVLAVTLTLAAALPDALIALWLRFLGEAVIEQRRGLLVVAVVGLGVSATGTWFLRTVSGRVTRRFRDRVTIALESHVARLQASVSTVAHQERPEYLDRLAVLRNQVFVLDHLYMSLFTTAGWALQLVVTIGLLVSIHPLLALLAVCALPSALSSVWRPGVERAAEERAAPANRLARHLFVTATTAPAGKEVRVTGIGQRLVADRRAAWQRGHAEVSAARWGSAVWNAAGWAVFGVGYVTAVVLIAESSAGAGDVLLVLAAGARLSGYVGATIGEISFLRGIWMDGAQRLVWLERYAAALDARADLPVPAELHDGIRFEHVSFAYPGTTRQVLDDVTLHLPAGSVVAVVGENGAGKSTLVKLLCKLYEPDAGRILIDGEPLARMPAEQWRSRLTGAFQDFFRFEFRAGRSVGVGDVPRLDDGPAVVAAVDRAGAEDVVQRLRAGLESQLGSSWPDGVEVSFGQWQKLALARGFMRDAPLVQLLDEPTAALDAETEHALFERYAAAVGVGAAGGGLAAGRITILVSHRFSTVRMADLIVVMDGARVAEVGSHAELLARGGQYAELYGIQAAAYG
jgi:ATP-binding cassette subfamily B protein